ncbi:L-threonine 3-dehydrogenase [Siminovitchia fortis]|uniref:L-threonine 3-dehydrogenase n=1 Tax=Siminovitchia fortis TaxID=254758 RepID=A0A451GBT2_9BACI|nr:L-threonine 3-dehydrogenase [Siminovitchia fortis]RWR12521.1 L-threonine 3-dehydrogenase [Siminovitchia fortis]WHY81637.1 L-threonine 3-dehydrogenase [Siminovitchia fortis]
MKKILVTGSLGQIGSELAMKLRQEYGSMNVIASDIRRLDNETVESGPFIELDVMDGSKLVEVAKKYGVDTIIHLAALLSASAETKPLQAWNLNMGSLINVLEAARELRLKVFVPSSIGAFGSDTPKQQTPQVTIQRPSTMYGINKVAGELLCDYYFHKYGVDTRGVRFPGLVSYVAPPGGGTTDYAVEIYFEATRKKRYTCFVSENTCLDLMYMPDALKAVVQLMEADPGKLRFRNSYNITAMSATPEDIANEIKKHIPSFEIDYKIDPVRQAIADSWPDSLDDSAARKDWGFKAEFGLEEMTEDMLEKVKKKRS